MISFRCNVGFIVGLFVAVGSIVLMAFFPWIFAKADVPLIYAYGTFIAFLISALLGYFINYKMIVLSADHKEYKITIETQGIKVIKVFIQIFVIWKFPYGYIFWIALEILAGIVTSIRLVQCVKKEYPWLIVNVENGKELAQKYPFVLTKTNVFPQIWRLCITPNYPFNYIYVYDTYRRCNIWELYDCNSWVFYAH